MMWASITPVILIIFGFNLSDGRYVRSTMLAPSMTKCIANKAHVLRAIKREIGDYPTMHLSSRCTPKWSLSNLRQVKP